MHSVSIEPYDNSKVTGYVATTLLIYIPSDSVNSLAQMLHNPNSRLYDQPNAPVRTLLSMLDPTIPLLGDDTGSSSGFTNFNGGGANSGSRGNDGSADDGSDDDGANSSSPVHASSVGIGLGVVGGAAVYGAGMVWIARRYRKKRQLHRRVSSTASQMRQEPGSASLFVSGGRLSRHSHNSRRSNRTQMISAPVTAENSLGWN